MLTIHVWPKRLKEFLLTHPLYKSPGRMEKRVQKKAGTIAAVRAAMAGGPFFCPRDEGKKRAGGVLLSHGRVPHYPRRWGA